MAVASVELNGCNPNYDMRVSGLSDCASHASDRLRRAKIRCLLRLMACICIWQAYLDNSGNPGVPDDKKIESPDAFEEHVNLTFDNG